MNELFYKNNNTDNIGNNKKNKTKSIKTDKGCSGMVNVMVLF